MEAGNIFMVNSMSTEMVSCIAVEALSILQKCMQKVNKI
jgi:hypothetical protein